MGLQMMGLNVKCIVTGYLLVTLIVWGSAAYTNRVNSKRADADPLKKNYHPYAIRLIFIWPILVLGWLTYQAFFIILYGFFLILFTIALVAFRRPFLFILLDKAMTRIGNKILKANTFLINTFFPQWKPQTGSPPP